jgi:hypothetical protein
MMHGKRYWGPAIAGLGAGFFLGFLLAGEGIIPYSVLTKSLVLVCALVLTVAGQIMARAETSPQPPEASGKRF